MPPKRANKPFPDELRRLLKSSGVTMRSLADAIGVNQSYLSRTLSSSDPKASRPVSAKVAVAVAEYFELPYDYFGEYREASVHDAVRADPKLRDRVYDSLPKSRR